VNHRLTAVLLAAATTVLLSIVPSADAATVAPGQSGPTPCPHSFRTATMTVKHNPSAGMPTDGFTFDNPCSVWVVAIFLGAPNDAVFRFYAAPGAHIRWNADQARKNHIKDGFNGNPIMIKAPHCAKQGRKELIAEANGRVHTNKPC
jgi:hypothetical protein